MAQMRVADFVMKFLSEQGVQDVFLLSGGGCMHLVDALGRHPDLNYVCNLHEQACAIAAEAYAQYTNNLGVVLVTTGPGATNAITGLAGAYLESTPTLFISGQVKRADIKQKDHVRQLGPQEVDTLSVVQPLTKYSVLVEEPEKIRYYLEKAYYLAKEGRPGPVWLDIPLDVQAALIESDDLVAFEKPQQNDPKSLTSSAKDLISFLKEKIAQSKRPIFLLGNGVKLSAADNLVNSLLELSNIPVLTTWKAADLIADAHPLFIGRPGSIGQRAANFAQQNSDLFISIGARLDKGQTAFNPNNVARSAHRIIVDIDASELDKLEISNATKIQMDAQVFIESLINIFQEESSLDSSLDSPSNSLAWLKQCQAWKEKYPVVSPEYWEQKEKVNHYVLVDVLSDLLTSDDIIVPGSSGACSEVVMQAFKVKKGQRIINTMALGAMGFGLPASLGVAVASRTNQVINVNGDGGFQLNIQELETVKRLNLPIKFFVLDNNSYASIMTTQNNYFEGLHVASTPDSGVTLPDITKLAAAYGIQCFTIKDHQNIRERVAEVLEWKGPAICRVVVDPNQHIHLRVKSAIQADGTMKSLPMEDLWPFLSLKEFKENMLIEPLPESLELHRE